MKNLWQMVVASIFLSTTTAAVADTWTGLTPATCPASSNGLFTTGQQYVDANNGVLQDSWSMLVRWQNFTAPTRGPTSWFNSALSYNAGTYTGYTAPTPYSTWQRGYQPESQAAATPGVQLNCFDAGMILNSWYTPHGGPSGTDLPVLGGGFNDMYGYAWSSANRPWAFKHFTGIGVTAPNDLVLQAVLAAPALQGYEGTQQKNGTYTWVPAPDIENVADFGSAGYYMFAYIRDTTHPSSPPIALLAQVYGNGLKHYQDGTLKDVCKREDGSQATGQVGWDYADNDIVGNPTHKIGVWYAATGICTTDISTVNYTAGVTKTDPFSTPTFFRIHYPAAKFATLINRIKNQQCRGGPDAGISSCNCNPGTTCPVNTYSSFANDYKLEYMGVLAETTLCDGARSSPARCDTSVPDSQIGFAVRASGVSAWANYP